MLIYKLQVVAYLSVLDFQVNCYGSLALFLCVGSIIQ